ncbi:MAG TPA: hypothetical protein VFN71_05415 [Methylomirabilota bacterium]|nr:hypothetical protein [Methylomirabilota bacterium]
MAQPTVAEQITSLHRTLESLESRIASGEVPVEGLADFKSSVDDFRLRLWGLLSAGTANDYRAFQERFRLRRTREICQGVAGEIRAGTLSPRHEELPPLGRAASDLARSIADLPS